MLAILFAVALDVAIRQGNPAAILDSFEAAEDAYLRQGRADRMLDLANRMLQRPNDPNVAAYLHARGLAYSQMHLPEPAWQALEQALPLAERSGNLAILGAVHRDRAIWIWRFQRDRARALREFDQAIDCGRRGKAWFVVTSSLHTSANLFRSGEESDLPEARRRLEEALAVSRREKTGVAHTLDELGDVYERTGDRARAQSAFEEAAKEADRNNVAEVRWEARNDLALLLEDSDPARAERYFRESIDLLEAHQNDVALADFRPSVLAGAIAWMNPFDDYIDFLLRHNRSEDAFLVAERERARAFLETLSASRDALAREAPAAFTAAERQLLDHIKTAQAALRTESLPDAKRADVVAGVAKYESQLSDLRLKLAVDHPSLAHARYPKLWSVRDLQARLLAPDESLISFYLGGHQSVAWVIARDRVSMVVLPAAKEIERAVPPALDALRTPTARDDGAISVLGRELQIDAIARLASGSRLVIVPHGALNDFPLEALLDSSGHMLVERFAISYAPSASSLAFLRSQSHPPANGATLIAVANPIVGATEAAALRQVDLQHVNLLAPLPQSGREAERIASLFGASSRVLEGPQATRSRLRTDARILHFATHGLIDETRPERSGLVLTADPPRDDGLLQVRDIYGLRLNADLVTLSACETALGQNVKGEGIVGLTRAFFFAGARSVVASLWDVDDASTSDLMQRFYTNIRAGQPIDLALQHAKIDFIRSGNRSAFYWASFVVSGNARATIPAPPSSHTGVEVATIVLIGIAAAGYFSIVKVRRGETATLRP